MGDEPRFFVPNGGRDPESVNPRYGIRGNGLWTFVPSLTPTGFDKSRQWAVNVQPVDPAGLRPLQAGTAAEVVFKVQSANVTTGQTIRARFLRNSDRDTASVAVSTTNGLHWRDVWSADETGPIACERNSSKK